MRELYKCPLCNESLSTMLIANFRFCKNCEVAVRNENDMPTQNNIYDKNWAENQEKSKYILNKSYYLLSKIKKLDGVKRILDVGCGTGILVDILTKNGFSVTGIDSSHDAIDFARKNKQGEFKLVSIESFQSPEKYDLIISSQLIEHLRYPENFLKKTKSLLKPNGYLMIETPNLKSWNIKSIWRRRIGGMFYGTDHRICYTIKSLTFLLRNNGYDIYKSFSRTFSPTILTEFIKNLRGNNKKEFNYKNSPDYPIFISIKSPLKKIYVQVKDSFIINVLLFFPNRISELKYRGNQLIVIAKKVNELVN